MKGTEAVDLIDVLKLAIDPADHRKVLRAPWLDESGFSTASDGRILIRITDGSPVELAPGKGKPPKNIAQLFKGEYSEHSEVAVEPLEHARIIKSQCHSCDGAGKVRHRCNCDYCTFTALGKCTTCDGLGFYETEDEETMFLGKCEIRKHYVSALSKIPGLVLLLPTENRPESCPIRFRWDHGDGLIAPYSPRQKS